jgi:hypothetical protein
MTSGIVGVAAGFRSYFYDATSQHLLVLAVQADVNENWSRWGVLRQGGWTAIVVNAVCPGGSCAVATSPLAAVPGPWLPRTYFKATLCDAAAPAVCKGSVFAQLNLDTFALFTRVNYDLSPGVARVPEAAVVRTVLEFSGGVTIAIGGLTGLRNNTILTQVGVRVPHVCSSYRTDVCRRACCRSRK